jgi:DNA topoisomerase-1
LAQPKAQRRGFGKPREPLKTLGESPATKQSIQLFEGRYGPYVTDGETNASVPQGTAPDQLTLEQAVDLLAARAALGPSKKGRRRKTAQRKTAAPRAAKKKAGDKKPAKKKAAKPKAAAVKTEGKKAAPRKKKPA